MRPQASSAPAGLGVQRHFEVHRLAGDYQTRAYEQVVPLEGRSDLAVQTPNEAEDARVAMDLLQAKGVAA